jgi:hypothetical protein
MASDGAVPLPKILRMPRRQQQYRKTEAEKGSGNESHLKNLLTLPKRDESSELNEITRWIRLADQLLGNNGTPRKAA